jgi:GNAT superfamily N-acetyltransferase
VAVMEGQQKIDATSTNNATTIEATYSVHVVEEKDRAEIGELTKSVYDGEDYWLHCITPWKASEHLLQANDKTGATYAHGLRLHTAAQDAGQLIALNAIQYVDNTFCWCMALRVAPEHRGKGAGSRVFRHGLDWAKHHGVKTFAMSTVSINHASLAIGNKFGFKIAPEWNQIAMKRSFPAASSLLTGPAPVLIVSKPSSLHGMLRRLISLDVEDAGPENQCLISTSWAYTPGRHSWIQVAKFTLSARFQSTTMRLR